jgi:hypothetical protein
VERATVGREAVVSSQLSPVKQKNPVKKKYLVNFQKSIKQAKHDASIRTKKKSQSQ